MGQSPYRQTPVRLPPCRRHPEEAAPDACARCNAALCGVCLAFAAGQILCAGCAAASLGRRRLAHAILATLATLVGASALVCLPGALEKEPLSFTESRLRAARRTCLDDDLTWILYDLDVVGADRALVAEADAFTSACGERPRIRAYADRVRARLPP
jgi:hypothetical protein